MFGKHPHVRIPNMHTRRDISDLPRRGKSRCSKAPILNPLPHRGKSFVAKNRHRIACPVGAT